MCLAVPGKIVSIDEESQLRMGKVDFGGAIRDICIAWLPEAKVGDYVLAHVGTALTLLDEEEAQSTLEALRELSELYPEEMN